MVVNGNGYRQNVGLVVGRTAVKFVQQKLVDKNGRLIKNNELRGFLKL